ncbi:LCP family protein [Eremococcus coleocola]|uniref:Cell envelope-like function transcriptional attenuator common domain protein n=1 Tax=Eremococcus coleocola ACS-139-V-Col8 TaxID=908337 RepID=E4KPG1_9LACT|nr:LCP family protein [Eremococcus coleocola]EFR31224.1 cell envelope-like function transcriptional attenuator common domain protein [Eremococcus coleocola ACS-139-V-Col8]
MLKKYFTNNKDKFSWWKFIRNIFIILLLSGAAFAGKLYADISQTIGDINKEISVSESNNQEDTAPIEGQAINVLLVGTDADDLERTEDKGFVGRSDTLMLVTLNPELKQTKIVSIPRDTLAEINSDHPADKINHAFAYGGIDLTISTVENFLNIPIDYYAVVNMSGLEELIDAMGGIEVTSPLTFEYRGTSFKKGETRQVNGVKAMNFARMRYDDPRGELGRQDRQKLVIQAVVNKALDVGTVFNYQKLLKVVSKNIQTNVNLNEAVSLLAKYRSALETISAVKFTQLEQIYIDSVFYFHIPLADRVRVSNELRSQLNLASISSKDLREPSDQAISQAKNLIVVINQYPTGVSDDKLAEIESDQAAVQTIRQTEVYRPSRPANNGYYNDPNRGTTDNQESTVPEPRPEENGPSESESIPNYPDPSTPIPEESDPPEEIPGSEEVPPVETPESQPR